jgi:hypothetical protein
MIVLQVVIALSGGEIIYFELSQTGQLLEVEKHDLAGDVVSMDIAPVPEGRQRSRFLAVASYDSKVGPVHGLLGMVSGIWYSKLILQQKEQRLAGAPVMRVGWSGI